VGAEVRTERKSAGEESRVEGERREKKEGGGREVGRKVEELRIGNGKTTEGRKETREKKAEGKRAEDGERRNK